MPSIAQQDYIVIDWEGKNSSDAAKKAEVDAILRKLYEANPLSLLSVVFANFTPEYDGAKRFMKFNQINQTDGVTIELAYADNGALDTYSFETSVG